MYLLKYLGIVILFRFNITDPALFFRPVDLGNIFILGFLAF
jgi:hypothetical protein